MLIGGKITIDFESENDFYEFAAKLEEMGCSLNERPEDSEGNLNCEYLSKILDK